jgi:tripeptide aminopeptidase
MTVTERFLKYIKFETTSNENIDCCPSTNGQTALAEVLRNELEEIGLADVEVSKDGYVYATIESNTDENIPTVGFIAHMDTSPDASGKDVKARIVSNYDGSDITLNKEKNITLGTKDFPELLKHKGEDIIVTDGTTLLGADDKAGIAEIMTAAEYLIKHDEIKHGRIRIAFTPDEEIGRGADKFDVQKFGADWAYTMDGGEVGELEFENFNAAKAKVTINGRNIHPGEAKGKMKNASLIAMEFAGMLPQNETPACTEGYEGFFHLTKTEGTVEHAELQYIIRDHSREKFEQKKKTMTECAEAINRKHGEGTAVTDIEDQYYNMRQEIEPVMHIVEIAQKAMEKAGVKPKVQPIRGGTDGAQLSFMGLPCPNIFAGGMNFHGVHEYVPVQSMEKATNVIIEIIKEVYNRKA